MATCHVKVSICACHSEWGENPRRQALTALIALSGTTGAGGSGAATRCITRCHGFPRFIAKCECQTWRGSYRRTHGSARICFRTQSAFCHFVQARCSCNLVLCPGPFHPGHRTANGGVQGSTSPQTAQLAGLLKDVARHCAKLDEEEQAKLKPIASKLAMPRQGMTRKNRQRLRPLDDPAVVAVACCRQDLPPRATGAIGGDAPRALA